MRKEPFAAGDADPRHLQLQQRFTDAILQTMEALVVVLDPQGRIERFNSACERAAGYSFQEVHGRSIWERLVAPEERLATRQALSKILDGGYPAHFENDWIRKDGSRVRIRWSNTALADDSGKVSRVIATGIDVSAMRKAEQDSLESESVARALLETAAYGIVAVHENGTIALANQAALQMFGYERDELLGSPLELLLPQGLLELPAPPRETDANPPESQFTAEGPELIGLRKGGSEFPVEVGLSRLETRDGRLTVAFVSDVSERRRLEQTLERSRRRLEALTAQLLTAQEDERRRLSLELHDDLTQKLAVLGMEIDLLKREIPSGDHQVRARLAALHAQVAALVDEVRGLSHELHPSVLEHSGLAPALEAHCREFQKIHGIRARVVTRDVPASIPPAVATSLYRIAQESMHNAARHSGASRVDVTLIGCSEGLRLAIVDDGRGFDVAGQSASGEGLGLVGVQERARLIGARLELQSEPNAGVRVRIDVPLSPR